MRLIDSHCHPQFPQYDQDREEMIKRSLDANIGILCVGTDLNDSRLAVQLARKYEGLWSAVGVHPNDISTSEFSIDEFEKLIHEDKVIAIGEVGLDYYRTTEPEDQNKQKETLQLFLDLAQRNNKPIVIHSRDAGKGSIGKVHADMLSILDSFSIRGVAHSFTGNVDEARKYLEKGYYLGFNGIITFAREYDDVVKFAPLDRILVETDAPFLAPEPYRGKRNEPLYVAEVAKKISELKGGPIDSVCETTTNNFRTLFTV